MSVYLGDYPTSAVIDYKWPTNAIAGESITRATDGSIRIYKGNSTSERSSSAGITDTEDFDGLTGVHHIRVDTSNNTDAGFYAAGSEYQIVLQGAVIDGKTINHPIAHFSIERSGGILALLKSIISGAGVNITLLGGSAIQQASGYIKVSEGTGTGQLDLTSGRPGIDWAKIANATTSVELSGTSVKTATQVETDTQDLQSKLGTPSNLGSGATVAANLVDIESQTDDIGTAGAGLTDLGGMSTTMKAQVQTEAEDALVANHLDHLLAAAYDPASKPGNASGLLNVIVENDSGVPRATANFLEQAPSGGSGGDIYGEAGSLTFTYTVYDTNGTTPLPGVAVYVSADIAGTQRSQTKITDDLGRVQFELDPTTVYFWRSRHDRTFSNPDTETVS